MDASTGKYGVKNPLTVIAIFAGLAELGGTVVLPSLSQETQVIYVWFLMIFPVILVTLFFVTLWVKHHVLYAPSDFKDESLFANIFEKAGNKVRLNKIEVETQDFIDSSTRESENTQLLKDDEKNLDITDLRARYLLAEELAIAKLGEIYNVNFDRGVRARSNSGYIFDAVAIQLNKIVIAEIKYTKSYNIVEKNIRNAFVQVDQVYQIMSKGSKKTFVFVLCIVTDLDKKTATANYKLRIEEIAKDFGFSTDIVVFDLRELSIDSISSRITPGPILDHSKKGTT